MTNANWDIQNDVVSNTKQHRKESIQNNHSLWRRPANLWGVSWRHCMWEKSRPPISKVSISDMITASNCHLRKGTKPFCILLSKINACISLPLTKLAIPAWLTEVGEISQSVEGSFKPLSSFKYFSNNRLLIGSSISRISSACWYSLAAN